MKKNVLVEIDEMVRSFLNEHASLLDSQTINEVIHYLNSEEHEMALEGLLIDIIEDKILLSIYWKGRLFEAAKQLNLDKETVFDNNIWAKFREFITKG